MSLCETDYVYNNNTGLCEKPLIIPPDHCTPFNNYNFVYNANTKKCESNIYDEKIEIEDAHVYGMPEKIVCLKGYTMDPSTNKCTKKTVIDILLTKNPVQAQDDSFIGTIQTQDDSFIGTIQAQDDSFIGTIQGRINQLPPQQAHKVVPQQAHKVVPQPIVKETNNTLIYILLFIMFVIALVIGYFYTRKKK
jgi:hypothetical protein